MKTPLIVLLLLLSPPHWANAQDLSGAKSQAIETVGFCELMSHPDEYDGKTVQLTAIYAASFHYAAFFDNSCKEEVRAQFLGTEGTVAFDRLSKFLKSYKTRSAQLTVIARF